MNRPEESYPVGKVNTLRLLPMSFEEFLWAQGTDYLTDETSRLNWQLMKDTDVKLQEHLQGLRISMKSHIDQGWMENIPLYAVEFFIQQTMAE